ncbi:hypothetical protein [Idiomarina abyssalis]|uniref:hypothetical protein n=1 Tax=Idiomarina abyssalis TaxID=86102 RepID=UPI001CD6CBEB|nr:hypothetical protein [Idiomarina abyssalis]
MKISWLLIVVVLIHSFFTCASAAGHIEDSSHQSVDVVFDSDHDIEHKSSTTEQSALDHEHQFHAHISCITGYGIAVSATPVILASNSNSVDFGQSLTHQPPVPPPNA